MIDLKPFKDWLLIQGSAQASAMTHCEKVAMYFRQYNELTQENLNSFLSTKLNTWNGSSFNLFLNAMKHFAKFSKLEIEFPPYRKVDTQIKEYITEKELDDILRQVPMIFTNAKKVEVILLILFELGLRPKELKNLKREHFDLEKKTVLITKTKVFRDRKLPLSDKVCTLLFDVFQQEAEELNAFNITEHGLGYIFRQIKSCLNLKKEFTPYVMRHSYAHSLTKQKINMNTLQMGMGHKNISTTLGYNRVSDEEASEEIRTLLNKRRK